MKVVYRYTNTGIFPVRSLVTRRRAVEECPTLDQETESKKKSPSNLTAGFTTAGISQATQRKIKKHSAVLANLAEKKVVQNHRGDRSHHLCTFITLTLPSAQDCTDAEANKILLQPFLDKCRKFGLLSNYVWRAEKQKNGNVHYHVITDSFAHYSLFRRIWLLVLRNSGHLEKYSEKFRNMSFREYSQLDFNKNASPTTVASRYARGKRTDWSEPPAIDVQFTSDTREIGNYIAKYIAKNDNDCDLIVNARCWGCSQSVSKATATFCKDSTLSEFWYNVSAQIAKKKEIITDFYSVVLWSWRSFSAFYTEAKNYVNRLTSEVFQPCRWHLRLSGGVPLVI